MAKKQKRASKSKKNNRIATTSLLATQNRLFIAALVLALSIISTAVLKNIAI